MSMWMYQMNQKLWEPQRYRVEIGETERWSWSVGHKVGAARGHDGAIGGHQLHVLRRAGLVAILWRAYGPSAMRAPGARTSRELRFPAELSSLRSVARRFPDRYGPAPRGVPPRRVVPRPGGWAQRSDAARLAAEIARERWWGIDGEREVWRFSEIRRRARSRAKKAVSGQRSASGAISLEKSL
jgi:hypothetical protein